VKKFTEEYHQCVMGNPYEQPTNPNEIHEIDQLKISLAQIRSEFTEYKKNTEKQIAAIKLKITKNSSYYFNAGLRHALFHPAAGIIQFDLDKGSTDSGFNFKTGIFTAEEPALYLFRS